MSLIKSAFQKKKKKKKNVQVNYGEMHNDLNT
jgi:hypothetical protein